MSLYRSNRQSHNIWAFGPRFACSLIVITWYCCLFVTENLLNRPSAWSRILRRSYRWRRWLRWVKMQGWFIPITITIPTGNDPILMADQVGVRGSFVSATIRIQRSIWISASKTIRKVTIPIIKTFWSFHKYISPSLARSPRIFPSRTTILMTISRNLTICTPLYQTVSSSNSNCICSLSAARPDWSKRRCFISTLF